MTDKCDHRYVYGGIKYCFGEHTLPGSGAHNVYYYDWFYCEKCLDNKYEKLAAEHDSYQKIKFSASPLHQTN